MGTEVDVYEGGGISMFQIVDRPGYFGKKRPQKTEFYDYILGAGKWSEMWQIGERILPFEFAVELYDEAYYQHLSQHPETADFIQTFGECYDNDPSNVKCGCQHDNNAVPRHIQDISVRRALKKLGVWFSGPETSLLQIRGESSNGFQLNPGNVPFHDASLILHGINSGPCPKWAHEGSVEHFWQANKIIVLTDRL